MKKYLTLAALAAIAGGVVRHTMAGRSAFTTVLLAPSRTSLPGQLEWDHVVRGEDEIVEYAEKLIEELNGTSTGGRYAFFIDSLTDFTGTAAEDPLDRLIRAAVRSDQFVVGEGESSTWGQAWALAKSFRAARRGLVLVPGEMDADQLTGTSVGRFRVADFPPGRGFLIGGGTAAKVQVALGGI